MIIIEPILLRDKQGIGFKCRIDDISIIDLVFLLKAIEEKIKSLQEDILESKKLMTENNNELFIEVMKNALTNYISELNEYKRILLELKRNQNIKVNCNKNEIENLSFDEIRKNYKKI